MRTVVRLGVVAGLWLALVVGAPGATRAGQAAAAGSAGLPVVTSNTVLADFVAQVGGAQVRVRPLVPRGIDPHTFQPTPAAMTLLTQARVIFFNGAGLEEWWAKTLRSVKKPGIPVVELSRGLATLTLPGDGPGRAAAPDPHLWLDPILAKTYVERIRDALATVDPGNAAAYTARAAAYAGQLDALDAWIRAEVAQIPAARRKLVTFHDAFQYFAKRYGLTVKGYVVSSPGKEPSAKAMADLARRIREEQVPAVFAEADYNPKLLEVLGRETGVTVVTDLYDDSLSAGPLADSYLTLMRHDVTMIVSALK
jgi:ABC-type Zn uptake system ZnuABC Zn-binding protein ZnuA